jgi:hypothetical protein
MTATKTAVPIGVTCLVIAVASAQVLAYPARVEIKSPEKVPKIRGRGGGDSYGRSPASTLPPPLSLAGPSALRLAAALRRFHERRRGVDGRTRY